MTITRIVSVPYELPHAHLYLDDVEQICRVLSDASQTIPRENPIVTTFSIKNLQMDSIEDLEKCGRSATNFRIKVSRGYSELSIELSSFSSPKIHLYSLGDEAAWATYSKIKAIFDARQFSIKNTIIRFPGWVKFSLWAFFALFFPFVILGMRTRWVVDITYWLLFYVVFFVMVRPSRVSFVHSHERSKLALENRKGYIKAIVLLLLGAVVGKIVEMVSQWMKARGH
jgi:hypothetical protein